MSRKELSSPRGVTSTLLRVTTMALMLAGSMLMRQAGSAQTKVESSANSASDSQSALSRSSDGYAGSQACSRCHLEIYRKFSQTSMGRSMSLVTPASIVGIASSATYLHEKLNRKFEVYVDSGKLYQSESPADGKESFKDAHQIEWTIGAGVNGFGAIIQKDNYLFQAPLSFYSKPKSWAPSPGYEYVDLGFNRPITAGCIFCHSGRPNSVAGTNGKFESTPFSELAIGCEKCHGPGAAHIQAMHASTGKRSTNPHILDSTIVNPARLTPYLADNICMACHQTGDVRILKQGKTFADIRPGKPLDETLSILMIPPTREAPPTADHVEHYYSMTLSKCYRASKGSMSCITCHDPHVEPTKEEAPAYFAAKCLTCHTNQSCQLPLETRAHQTPANNCIGCHMPKRDIQVISHSSATNHRIVATADEPFPDVTFSQTTSALPDLIHVNPAPGKQADALPLLTLLSAYGQLSENKPEYIAAYLKVLGQLEKTQPDDSLVQAALGRKALKGGDLQAAVTLLQNALKSDPLVATTYEDLADALSQLGQKEQAIPLIQKAIELDPFNPVTRKLLVVRLVETRQYSKAHDALEHYLEIFPQDDFMRQMLARAEGKSGQP